MYIYAAVLAALLPLASCIYADEAYQIDFHYALLGEPQASSTFFHQPVKGSKASLLYTLSDKSVLGAVNPKDGALVWRQLLSPNRSSTPAFVAPSEDQGSVFSAAGSRLSSWSAADGRLVWEKDFDHDTISGLAVEQGPRNDAFVLVQGSTSFKVHKFDGSIGSTEWTHEDTSGDAPYGIVESSGALFLVSLHTTMLKALKIKITSLNMDSGKVSDQYTLSSDGDISSVGDILFTGSAASHPIVAWTDSSRKVVKVNILGTKDIRSLEASSNLPVESVKIHTSDRPNTTPCLVIHYETSEVHWADVFEVDGPKTNLRKVYSLPSVPGKGVFSVSATEDKIYIVRITRDSLSLFPLDSSTTLATWPIDLQLPVLADKPGPIHATAEVAARSGSSFAVRAAILLSSGDWVLVRNGEILWTRPEALAGIVEAKWAELPENEDLAQDLEIESSSNMVASFLHRASRHLNALKRLPSWVRSLLMAVEDDVGSLQLKKDTFGFRQLLLASTANGRLIAIDMGDKGKIAWNRPMTETTQRLSHSDIGGLSTTYSLEQGTLRGHKAQDTKTLWSFKPLPGYRIMSVTPPLALEPVASIGKVLGDRRVLYKYLNPNAVVVMAVNDQRRKAAVTVLDGVSGSVLYTSEHESVDTSRSIATAISENWMAFSYSVDSPLDSVSKGFQLVMAEFYESDIPNDRGLFDIASNYSALRASSPPSKPYVVSQSFHVPEEITKMAVTQTRQGITSRMLLVGLSGSNSIVGIPSYILDPRRTVGKDPTPTEREEGLSKYTPMIDFDPKWYLNHYEEILGVEEILTKPSLLESTSLVVAFGHDIFGTRVSPSFAFDILGNSFNKIQLVLTVVALQVGVFIVAPLIQRKQTNALWQSS